MKNIYNESEKIDQQLKNVKPDPPKKTRKELIEDLVIKYMDEYGITNDYMKAAMMGIILNEGGFSAKPENLYYTTPGRLAEVWSVFSNYTENGKRKRAPEGEGSKYANELAKSGKYLENPEALGNFIYANQKGNEPGTGDGYRYRGRGLNQLTGKGAYKSLGDALGVDLVNNPELLETDPDLQAKAAVHFLHKRLSKTLPRLVEKYSTYNKRFGNYVDYNNIDNLKDASFILTSANAGFGSYPKEKTFSDRLASAKKYEAQFIQNKDRWQDEEFDQFEEEQANVPAPEPKDRTIVSEPSLPETPVDNTTINEKIIETSTPINISPLPIAKPDQINLNPKRTTSPQIVQNYSDEELKKQTSFLKRLSNPLFTNSSIPRFAQGSNLFNKGHLFGADKKRTGGSINIKPENKGKFTAKANAAGMGVQAFANKVLGASEGTYSPSTRRQANFARNASKWNRNGGTLYPRYFDNGGPLDGFDDENMLINKPGYSDPIQSTEKKLKQFDDYINPLMFNIDPETENLKQYNFDTGQYEVTDTPVDLSAPGATGYPMSHYADRYADDDMSLEAVQARKEKAEDLVKYSQMQVDRAGRQISDRSIRSLGKTLSEQGASSGYIDWLAGRAECISGSSCNLSPTIGEYDEPLVFNPESGKYEIETNYATIPYFRKGPKGKGGSWRPNTKWGAGTQKRGTDPTYSGKGSSYPGWNIPVIGGNASFLSRFQPFGMQVMPKGTIPKPGDIQVQHAYELPGNYDNHPSSITENIQYGRGSGAYHAMTFGPETDVYPDGYYDFETDEWIETGEPTKELRMTNNPGGGEYSEGGTYPINEPLNPADALVRYQGDLPYYQDILKDTESRYKNVPRKTEISPLPMVSSGLLTPKKTPKTLPSVLLEQARQFENRGYRQGGTLAKPCSNGQIYDETLAKCVSYATWEKNNANMLSKDFTMKDVKNLNEEYAQTADWFKKYQQSPRYKEMLRGSFPEGFIGDMSAKYLAYLRGHNLESTPPIRIRNQEEDNIGGFSNTNSGRIVLYPEAVGTETGAHEASHSIDRPVNTDNRIIPVSDSKYIQKRKPKYIGDTREYWNNKKYWDWLKQYDIDAYREQQQQEIDWTDYVGEDTETRARLNTFRKLAQDRGIYDPFTEKVTPELYYDQIKDFKLIDDPYKEGYNPIDQLQDAFSDDEIIWMLNNISKIEPEIDNDIEGIA